MRRPRFHLRTLLVAVVIAGVVFAALRYDVGRRGYAFFLTACIMFTVSALAVATVRGRARLIALVIVAASCLVAWGVFALFGVS